MTGEDSRAGPHSLVSSVGRRKYEKRRKSPNLLRRQQLLAPKPADYAARVLTDDLSSKGVLVYRALGDLPRGNLIPFKNSRVHADRSLESRIDGRP